MPTITDDPILSQTEQWLDQVVIGLNLCPFASKPRREQRVAIRLSQARDEGTLLADLQAELSRLHNTPTSELETSLLVIPHMLDTFEDYNQFLDLAELLLREFGWEGEFQIASFHPHYCFAGARPEAAENLTNRSPYPILHLIREASLEYALQHFTHPENIPVHNIQRMEALTETEKKRYFAYLFS